MTSKIAVDFGHRVCLRRQTLNLSQKSLAMCTGLTQAAISFIESGLREPQLSTIVKLCIGLECLPNDLIEIGDDHENKSKCFTRYDK